MKIIIPLFLCFLLFGCSHVARPKENNIVKAHSPANQIVRLKSYDIPEAVFRGVLWPSPDNADFEVWIIKNKQEIFYRIPAPPEVVKWRSDVTDQWVIQENMTTSDKKEYSLKRKEGTKSLTIEVPRKNRGYSFFILQNDNEEDTVLFMDIDEKITDTGLCGYIVIK